MKAKRRIHKFNFDQETMKSGNKTHVALVDKAANLTEALILKASTKISSRTEESEEYDDNGNYETERDSVRVIDDGSSEVRIIKDYSKHSSFYVRIR